MDSINIVPKFSKSELEQLITEETKKRLDDAILLRLQFVGEQFVALARNTNTYRDHTGNLRNSIGYVILKDGEQLFDNFQKSARVEVEIKSGKNKGDTKETTGSKDGLLRGEEFAKEIGAKHPHGWAIVGVCGMEYAAAVESRGYDVISGAATIAAGLLKEGFERLQHKLSENNF